ncbi:hypothetical protein DUNSADRAFT_6477 [Dunaliella salina]|uniref:Uncharacterized protein n=1 Tax=Dunaliella salina TaxID=3046 RepID=A0ABQ7GND2_DUNSA|nr:hypothetical protein DUNSADRAFT_6477 [Dunaliella salina]KAF5836107.1 hypothetical protein DUNSADRAFT_6477 [Dunaliella salina]|eukprot:KAF5836106.1 hypothetical protein DUNSADRAFT_6477 [Dunaliella salina]
MATASLDTVGFCPGPAQKANRGASDLLEGQLFAYGCGSGVVVMEVQQLQVAATLEGVVHKGGAVTSVKWCPMCHSRDLISDTHLRLASGDSNGGVAVWDVQCQSVCATLDDALLAVPGNNAPKLGVVHGLEWVTAKPFLLATLMAPATLLVWDTQGDVIVWQRELTSSVPEPFVSMCQDPLDWRRLCVSGPGHLAIVTLTDLASDDVEVKQFKLETRGTGNKADTLRGSAGVSVAGNSAGMQAVFSSTRGLLFVLLPWEIQALDMELGVPATSRALPSGRAPFVALLGVYGRGVSHGGGDEGGSDCCYALHADGTLTIWLRIPGELRYTLSCASRLMPPISRNAAQSLSLLAVRAQVWKHDVAVDELVRRPWLGSTEEVTCKLQSLLLPDSAAETAPGAEREGGSAFARTGNAAKSHAAAAAPSKPSQPTAPGANTSRQSLLIMSVTSDGKVWQWDAPLPRFSDRSFITSVADTPLVSISGSMQPSSHQPPPPAAAPMLVGMLHTLPHAVTTLNLFPKLLATGKKMSMPAPPHPDHMELPSPTPPLPPKPKPSSSGGRPAAATAGGGTQGEAAAQRAAAWAAAAGAAAGGGAGAGPQGHGTSLNEGQSAGAQGDNASENGGGGEVVEVALMGAAVTAAGNVELFTLTRGQASPLAAEVAVSLNVHRHAVVRGVRWLGSTPRLVSFTVERVQVSAQQAGAALAAQEAEGAHPPGLTAWRNVLAITDVRSRRSTHFREVPPEPHPLLGLRASPSGAHLLLLIKGAPAELWKVDTDKPARLRLLDLPFTAVEWVQPAEVLTSHMTSVDDVADWHQQHHRQRPMQRQDDGARGEMKGSHCMADPSHPHQINQQHQHQDMTGGAPNTHGGSSGVGSSAHNNGGTTTTPVGFGVTGGGEIIVDERLAFTLGDGRAGVLSVCGRHVADARAKRPVSSNGQAHGCCGHSHCCLGPHGGAR